MLCKAATTGFPHQVKSEEHEAQKFYADEVYYSCSASEWSCHMVYLLQEHYPDLDSDMSVVAS